MRECGEVKDRYVYMYTHEPEDTHWTHATIECTMYFLRVEAPYVRSSKKEIEARMHHPKMDLGGKLK